ncbi:hypothetical protein GMI69_10100 [Eggerthellaceae bacterium zg-887]|uniref:hypothetical protein n=1 Tax=Xiamenia xianingshaonis TaxID=2682776 RepID=UPI00140E240B|nr:hypothetical protein [Xiamenia xianingshaonis]NHM16986.1 hypothetical protein [Xiamenia xianingshaonis]
MAEETTKTVAQEKAAPTLPANYKPLSTGLKYFYGVGDFGFNIMNSVENYYFLLLLRCFFAIRQKLLQG